jgi:hypothetical protein
VPYTPDDIQRWNGERRPLSYYEKTYGVDKCFWTKDMHGELQERKPDALLLLQGVNSGTLSHFCEMC